VEVVEAVAKIWDQSLVMEEVVEAVVPVDIEPLCQKVLVDQDHLQREN
tara:strand:- start:1597 stop:1740 length:144 start_codon:yes stop_codon:yes gene_type:complete